MCAKAIINKGGVTKVIYDEPYRCKDGIELLSEVGIEVIDMRMWRESNGR